MPSIKVHMLVHAFDDHSVGDVSSIKTKCATAFGVKEDEITPFRLKALGLSSCDGAAEDDIAIAVHSSSKAAFV